MHLTIDTVGTLDIWGARIFGPLLPGVRIPDPTQDPIHFTSVPEEQERVRSDKLCNQADIPLGTARECAAHEATM